MKNITREKTAVLSVSLPRSLRARVIKYARKNDITVSQLVKNRLEAELFREGFEQATKGIRAAFKKIGLKTDEDVEKYFG